ncbi:hypothetical protein SMQC19_46750 (plasmid) [Serratia marcescens]|nr:hypothetical protein SMQC19_46750 [Serratia marcescens]
MALGGDDNARLAMTHVDLDASPVAIQDGGATEISVSLRVFGMTRKEYLTLIDTVFEEWTTDEVAAVMPDGYRIYITAVDKTGLTGI